VEAKRQDHARLRDGDEELILTTMRSQRARHSGVGAASCEMCVRVVENDCSQCCRTMFARPFSLRSVLGLVSISVIAGLDCPSVDHNRMLMLPEIICFLFRVEILDYKQCHLDAHAVSVKLAKS
jgi:hypothetical protein